MGRLALELAARALTIEGITCDRDLRLFFDDTEIGAISGVGSSVFVEVRAHPLDAGVLADACPQCTVGLRRTGAERECDGWVSFAFVSYPDSYTESYFLESLRSARERVIEGNGVTSGEGEIP